MTAIALPPVDAERAARRTASLAGLNGDLAEVAARVRPCLVRVHDGGRSAGAGVALHRRGLIVTNAHVVAGRRVFVEAEEGIEHPASKIRVDRRLDLAALMVQSDDLAPLPIGDSRALAAGSWVLAFGHPYGVRGAASAGIVIGSGLDLPEMPADGREWLAMSLRLRPGNSGGPVVDSSGQLVGLNAMMAGPGVGLAVPAHVIKEFLQGAIE
jgi:serine protease Do